MPVGAARRHRRGARRRRRVTTTKPPPPTGRGGFVHLGTIDNLSMVPGSMPPLAEIHAVHVYDGLTVVAFCGGAIELYIWHDFREAQWVEAIEGVALCTSPLGIA